MTKNQIIFNASQNNSKQVCHRYIDVNGYVMKNEILRYLLLLVMLVTGLRLFAQDNTPPARPYITYVTVDTATNDTHIYWTQSPSTDVAQYDLYYEIKTVNGYEGVKFDSVPATENTYTHLNSGAGSKSMLYSVTAVDSSGNESIRKPGLHSTVFTRLQYDSCQARIEVSWNFYQGWGNDVSGYRIMRSIANAPFEIVTGVNAVDSFYYDQNVSENTSYRYFIEAVKNDGLESFSNISTKYTRMPAPPANLYIEYATVPDENHVDISFSYTPNGETDDFSLLRSSNPLSDFQAIQSIYDLTTGHFIFTDDNIITATEKYYYKIGSVNTCGNVISTSNNAVNILLRCDTLGNSVRLWWNDYEEWNSGVMEYRIFRKEADGSFTLLDTTLPGVVTYTDNLVNVVNSHLTGELTYYVEAANMTGDAVSQSNRFRIRVGTNVINLPDAFTPNADGRNDSFIPAFDFRPSEYLMIIYNRAGVPVYTTEDPEKGWDGTVNGTNPAQEGVYVYHIQYKSYNGTRGEKTGHVTVFYP